MKGCIAVGGVDATCGGNGRMTEAWVARAEDMLLLWRSRCGCRWTEAWWGRCHRGSRARTEGKCCRGGCRTEALACLRVQTRWSRRGGEAQAR